MHVRYCCSLAALASSRLPNGLWTQQGTAGCWCVDVCCFCLVCASEETEPFVAERDLAYIGRRQTAQKNSRAGRQVDGCACAPSRAEQAQVLQQQAASSVSFGFFLCSVSAAPSKQRPGRSDASVRECLWGHENSWETCLIFDLMIFRDTPSVHYVVGTLNGA